MKNVVELQEALLQKVSASNKYDNTVEKITTYPAVVVDIDDERPRSVSFGVVDGEFSFMLYVLDIISNHSNSISQTRQSVATLIRNTLNELKVNVEGAISYDCIVIEGKKAVVASVRIITQ